jgi:hypothetical protein
VTKTGDLRKDKLDPVAGFSFGPQFGKDSVIDALLRVEEVLEIVRLNHGLLSLKDG